MVFGGGSCQIALADLSAADSIHNRFSSLNLPKQQQDNKNNQQ
jgi:hypothetical protein